MDAEEVKKWHSLLKTAKFFNSFSDADIYEVLKKCKIKKFKANSTVFSQNDKDYSFHVILKGKVHVFVTKRMGGDLEKVSEVFEGECMGEIALLLSQPRSTTVRAYGDVMVLIIQKENIDRWKIETREKLYKQFAVQLATTLRRREMKDDF